MWLKIVIELRLVNNNQFQMFDKSFVDRLKH